MWMGSVEKVQSQYILHFIIKSRGTSVSVLRYTLKAFRCRLVIQNVVSI